MLEQTDLFKVSRPCWLQIKPQMSHDFYLTLLRGIVSWKKFMPQVVDHKLFIEMLLEINAPRAYNKKIKERASLSSKDILQCESCKRRWASVSVYCCIWRSILSLMKSLYTLVNFPRVTFLMANELSPGTSFNTQCCCRLSKEKVSEGILDHTFPSFATFSFRSFWSFWKIDVCSWLFPNTLLCFWPLLPGLRCLPCVVFACCKLMFIDEFPWFWDSSKKPFYKFLQKMSIRTLKMVHFYHQKYIQLQINQICHLNQILFQIKSCNSYKISFTNGSPRYHERKSVSEQVNNIERNECLISVILKNRYFRTQ